MHYAAVVRNSRDIDMSAIQGSRSKAATSRRASCPSRIQQSSDTTKVERKSRISFECHMDLLMEELMDDFDDMMMQEFLKVEMDAQQWGILMLPDAADICSLLFVREYDNNVTCLL